MGLGMGVGINLDDEENTTSSFYGQFIPFPVTPPVPIPVP